MDMLRHGYVCKMQTDPTGARPATEVVWYRLQCDPAVLKGWSPFRSRNYLKPEEGQTRNYTPGEHNLEESDCSRSCRLPWYRGEPPAPYLGGLPCGDPNPGTT